MADDSNAPRSIKRIVFGYTHDFFPGALILGHNQLKRMIARAGFDIAVSFAPLSDLPAPVDILFVPAELAQVARTAAPSSQIQAIENFVNAPAYDQLIQQLNAGIAMRASRLSERVESDAEKNIVRYRGYERIE
ncbi:MAG: hypothetical protein HZC40_25430 [Chloroflexi bacterium]|nr:hypothetical protein [Chloroflexota bacterium]